MMKINMNTRIKVKLSDFGLKVYMKHHEDNLRVLKQHDHETKGYLINIISKIKDGVIEMLLWEAFCIFGEHCNIGNESIFDPNEIEVLE